MSELGTCVEWIDAVPALRSELAALADDRVEVAQGEEDRLELVFFNASIERVLQRRSRDM